MQRVEDYIESYTRRCSNRYDEDVAAMLGEPFAPWLTPEHARSVAVIAAEETADRIRELLLSRVLPRFMHGGEAREVVAALDEALGQTSVHK